MSSDPELCATRGTRRRGSEDAADRIVVSVTPRSNLKGKPVRVLIENVYLLAVPTDSSKATPEEDEARSQAAKQEKLESAEMINSQSGGAGLSEEEEKKNESFTASLVTKIVDNLQIEVSGGIRREATESS